MPTFHAVVTVELKESILDPAGEAAQGVLKHMGFAVDGVRIGRHIRLTLQAETPEEASHMARRMAEELLANPVMETFTVEVQA